jgi:hypothetical protein
LAEGTARRFDEGRAAAHRSPSQSWFRCLPIAGGAVYLKAGDELEFVVSSDGRRIWYLAHDAAALDSLNVYLLGHVLSFSLLARGIEPLHGSVVSVGGHAVVFAGDCGEGKSTLVAAFLARGCQLVSDDLVVLVPARGGWRVRPGVPRLKLFPDVAARLLGTTAGCRMHGETTKLVLPLDRSRAVHRPVLLKAMYVLAPAANDRRGARVRITPLSGSAAFLEVVRAAFNLLVDRPARLANQFNFARQVSATVPIRRLVYPRRLSLLPAVCDAVVADLRAAPY